MGYARFDSNSLSNNGTSSSTVDIWAFVYPNGLPSIHPAHVRAMLTAASWWIIMVLE